MIKKNYSATQVKSSERLQGGEKRELLELMYHKSSIVNAKLNPIIHSKLRLGGKAQRFNKKVQTQARSKCIAVLQYVWETENLSC